MGGGNGRGRRQTSGSRWTPRVESLLLEHSPARGPQCSESHPTPALGAPWENADSRASPIMEEGAQESPPVTRAPGKLANFCLEGLACSCKGRHSIKDSDTEKGEGTPMPGHPLPHPFKTFTECLLAARWGLGTEGSRISKT